MVKSISRHWELVRPLARPLIRLRLESAAHRGRRPSVLGLLAALAPADPLVLVVLAQLELDVVQLDLERAAPLGLGGDEGLVQRAHLGEESRLAHAAHDAHRLRRRPPVQPVEAAPRTRTHRAPLVAIDAAAQVVGLHDVERDLLGHEARPAKAGRRPQRPDERPPRAGRTRVAERVAPLPDGLEVPAASSLVRALRRRFAAHLGVVRRQAVCRGERVTVLVSTRVRGALHRLGVVMLHPANALRQLRRTKEAEERAVEDSHAGRRLGSVRGEVLAHPLGGSVVLALDIRELVLVEYRVVRPGPGRARVLRASQRLALLHEGEERWRALGQRWRRENRWREAEGGELGLRRSHHLLTCGADDC
eukprot:6870802-Prymnesium_polylepis.1